MYMSTSDRLLEFPKIFLDSPAWAAPVRSGGDLLLPVGPRPSRNRYQRYPREMLLFLPARIVILAWIRVRGLVTPGTRGVHMFSIWYTECSRKLPGSTYRRQEYSLYSRAIARLNLHFIYKSGRNSFSPTVPEAIITVRHTIRDLARCLGY